MALFDLDSDNKIILNADSLALPPLKKIWDKDKSKTKEEATKLITYIYLISDNQSPYMNYPPGVREERLATDIFKDINWKPSPEIIQAIDYYKDLTQTTSMRLLYSARIACHKLADYFEEADFTELDDNGKPIYTAKDVAANLGSIGKILESLDTLESKVKQEVTSKVKIRGGGNVGSYER